MEIKEKVENYIKELTNIDDLDTTLNLFEMGILTSLDVLDLINFIETEFQFELPVDDISVDTFGTVDAITLLITANVN